MEIFRFAELEQNESMGGMYCQSAKEIAAGIYHCLNVSPQIENERIFWSIFSDFKTGDIGICKEYGSFEWVDLFWNATIWTL